MKFIKQGDIFKSSCEVIANPINCVGVMGGGLALAFKKKFPEHFETYKKMCQNGEIKVGELYVIDGDEKHKKRIYDSGNAGGDRCHCDSRRCHHDRRERHVLQVAIGSCAGDAQHAAERP